MNLDNVIWIVLLFWALVSFFVAVLVIGHGERIGKLEFDVKQHERWINRDEKDLTHYGEILSELKKEKDEAIKALEEKISQLEQKSKTPNISEVLAKYFQESLDNLKKIQEQGDVNLVD